MTGSYPVRRTRTGALVLVLSPMHAADLVGELVDVIAPDGTTATARVHSTGRVWVDAHGDERTYAYLDPTSIVAGAA